MRADPAATSATTVFLTAPEIRDRIDEALSSLSGEPADPRSAFVGFQLLDVVAREPFNLRKGVAGLATMTAEAAQKAAAEAAAQQAMMDMYDGYGW